MQAQLTNRGMQSIRSVSLPKYLPTHCSVQQAPRIQAPPIRKNTDETQTTSTTEAENNSNTRQKRCHKTRRAGKTQKLDVRSSNVRQDCSKHQSECRESRRCHKSNSVGHIFNNLTMQLYSTFELQCKYTVVLHVLVLK